MEKLRKFTESKAFQNTILIVIIINSIILGLQTSPAINDSIGQILGITTKNVSVRLLRIKEQLRKMSNKEND